MVSRLANRLVLFGLPFENITMKGAISRIDTYVRSGSAHVVFTANVAMLMQWRRSPRLQRIYQDADMLTIDGMALIYASRLLGTPARESVSGSALFYEVMSLAREKGYRVFLLGADTDVLHAARERLEADYHPVRIVGMHHGYFGSERSAAVADLIRDAKPDILLLGMSSPLKEEFAWTYREHMQVPFTLGVGGMFDITAGRYQLAPGLVRFLCLEWLWRLMQEPRRLWRRYATTNSRFLWLLAGEIVRTRIRPPIRRLASRSVRKLLA
jgi:N-acetylglucosaminyldiphosphoundecaprenol N-acetyl-beta-D-mannosaminyltransferase